MKNKTIEQAKKDMSGYNKEDFKLYVSESGWESWMDEYIEAQGEAILKHGEPCEECEINAVRGVQRGMWMDVHGI
jgi:hypothetical protein